jgi:hypothetical protein
MEELGGAGSDCTVEVECVAWLGRDARKSCALSVVLSFPIAWPIVTVQWVWSLGAHFVLLIKVLRHALIAL